MEAERTAAVRRWHPAATRARAQISIIRDATAVTAADGGAAEENVSSATDGAIAGIADAAVEAEEVPGESAVTARLASQLRAVSQATRVESRRMRRSSLLRLATLRDGSIRRVTEAS
jgi:hypothetical protein